MNAPSQTFALSYPPKENERRGIIFSKVYLCPELAALAAKAAVQRRGGGRIQVEMLTPQRVLLAVASMDALGRVWLDVQ